MIVNFINYYTDGLVHYYDVRVIKGDELICLAGCTIDQLDYDYLCSKAIEIANNLIPDNTQINDIQVDGNSIINSSR